MVKLPDQQALLRSCAAHPTDDYALPPLSDSMPTRGPRRLLRPFFYAPMPMRPKVYRVLATLFLAIALYAGLILILRAIGLENVQTSIKELGIWSPVVFVVVCAISLVLAPLSAGSVFLTSGLLFGPQLGFVLCFLGSVVGCSLNFWISRKLGRKVATYLVGKNSLKALDRLTNRLQARHSLMLMIVLMPISQDIVSYAVGLTKVRFFHFFLALTISGIAVAATYAYLGSNLLEVLV